MIRRLSLFINNINSLHLISTITLLILGSHCFVSGQSQFNADSVIEIADQIEDKHNRLIYLDSVYLICIENNLVVPDQFIFHRQDLADQFHELEPSLTRAFQVCNYYLDRLNETLADSVLNRYSDAVAASDNDKFKLDWHSWKGNVMSETPNYNKAIYHYNEGLKLFNEGNLSLSRKANLLRNLGKNYIALNKFGEASLSINEAIKLSKSLNDSNMIEQELLDLGILFSQLGLYDEAQEYILERQNYINPPFPLSNAIDNINLARNLILQQRYDEAINMYQKALALQPFEAPYQSLPLYAFNGIVESHYFLNNMDSVFHYFDAVEDLFDELNRDESFKFLYLQSRWLYRMAKNQYSLAEQDGNELYQQALNKNDGAEVLMYSKFFSELYQKSGQYKNALHFTRLYSDLRDSLHTANKTQALLLYQTQFETTEKENTILSLKAERAVQELKVRSNRIRYFAGTIALILLGGFFFLRQFYRNRIERTKQVERLRTKISSDLHDDVGSILTGLAMQTEIMEAVVPEQHKSSLSKIATMSRSAMAHMRDAVWAMDARNDTWGSLIDRMHEFAHEMLEPKNIHYSIQTKAINKHKALHGAIRQNLYLIFKEAITNMIKHSKADHADVILNEKDGKFQMKISDSGIGQSKENYSGQGLSNIKMRAKEIGATATITTENGFTISIQSK